MPAKPKASTRSAPAQTARELVRFVQGELERLADERNARAMAAYMKTTQPFYGVMNTPRREMMRRAWKSHSPPDAAAWRASVAALFEAGKGAPRPSQNPVPSRRDSTMRPPVWRGRRELFYCACEFGERGVALATAADLPLFKSMIVQSGWWDIVDWVAAKMVGDVFARQPEKTGAVMERWVADRNLWVRRAAIISQIWRRDQTDTDMLARFCLATAHERDFFVRKAIGWALRQHARADPAWVRGFVKEHRDRLSGLSVREASRHL